MRERVSVKCSGSSQIKASNSQPLPLVDSPPLDSVTLSCYHNIQMLLYSVYHIFILIIFSAK